jgi:hypothetical protein
MSKLFKFFILVIILLVSSGFWFIGNGENASGDDWRPISEAPAALMQQFQKDVQQGEQVPDITKSQFLKVQQNGQMAPLYLIDTSPTIRSGEHPSLCGRMGCLFTGYLHQPQRHNHYKQITSGYLSQFLPLGTSKIEVTTELQNGLPCLKFNQLSQSRFDPQLVSTTYCFDGNRYYPKS